MKKSNWSTRRAVSIVFDATFVKILLYYTSIKGSNWLCLIFNSELGTKSCFFKLRDSSRDGAFPLVT